MEIQFHRKVENKFHRALSARFPKAIYCIIRQIQTCPNGSPHASYTGSKALKSKDF